MIFYFRIELRKNIEENELDWLEREFSNSPSWLDITVDLALKAYPTRRIAHLDVTAGQTIGTRYLPGSC